MLKRIALFFRMRRWNVWERLLLWRSSVYWGVNRPRETENRRDSPEGLSSSVHSIRYHGNISGGDSDFGSKDSAQPLMYHWLKKKKRINPFFYANVRVLRANRKSASNLWAQSETLLVALSLFHPTGRIVSQSQSWLSLPRPNKSSTYEFAHVNQTLWQMSELIKTMCNVTVEQSRGGRSG